MQERLEIVSSQSRLWFVISVVVALICQIQTALSQSSINATKGSQVSRIGNLSPLDGRLFSANIIRTDTDNKITMDPLGDQLMFNDGKFSSAICKNFNFAEAPYWIRMEDDQIHFLVELTSPTDGTMVWQGTIRGDILDGTMRWTKKRWYWKIDTEHKISGKLEKVLSNNSVLK